MRDLLCHIPYSSSGRERSEAARIRTLKDDDGNPPSNTEGAVGLEQMTAQTSGPPEDAAGGNTDRSSLTASKYSLEV